MKVSLIALATIAAASPLNFASKDSSVVPRDEGVIPWGKIFALFRRDDSDDIGDNYEDHSPKKSGKKGDKKPNAVDQLFGDELPEEDDDEEEEGDDDNEDEDEDDVYADATIKNLKNFRIIVDFESDDRLISLKQQNGTQQPVAARYGQDARFNLVNSTLTNLNGTRVVFDVLGSFGLVNGTFNATTNTTNTTILRTLPSNSAALLLKSSASSKESSSETGSVSEASESAESTATASSQASGAQQQSQQIEQTAQQTEQTAQQTAAGAEQQQSGAAEPTQIEQQSEAAGAEATATQSANQKRAEKESSSSKESSSKESKTSSKASKTSDAKATGAAAKEEPKESGSGSSKGSSLNSTSEYNSTGTIQVFAQNGTNVTSFPGWKIYENRLFYKDFTQWYGCPGKNNQTFHISTHKCKGGERVKLRVFV
ncbi:hypothetical protein DIURU_003515 [Diutina rugosa]|uniref:Uncharacterized protein n=1 Tax=Diutina rugosa TaxID=5481 RepID=A0A642UQG4_DIURU|nr:uncharacterized protein DIURU_003515 [Diutina rugosa]KAA8901145.1 hypothetical protein DIURU_003515 [Diutina rugosa]